MDTSDSVCRAQPLLGTFVEIRSAGANGSATERAINAAFAVVAKIHRLMSFHDGDSDVSRLNREACRQAVAVDPWTYEVLEAALLMHRLSEGAFDVAVAPVLQQSGLLPSYETDVGRSPAAAATSEAIALLPGRRVRFHHPGVRIDLGGIAKGFAVDRAIDILRQHGHSQGLVNAGGDLAVFGPAQEAVHVRHPRFPEQILCQVAITNAALASSGHLFNPLDAIAGFTTTAVNPATREFISGIAGATVRAPSCMLADALTKVVMIAGERAAAILAQCQASALVVLACGEVRVTPEWQDGICAAA
jgi:thiamine biosynthesis lipoprotein